MKTNIKDNAQFKDALVGIRKSGKELRLMAQNVVAYGFNHYAAHNDVEFLNRAFKACIGEAKLDTKQMGGYITAHANVKLKNYKQPKEGFIKSGKGEGQVNEPTVQWFNYEPAEKTAGGLKDELKAFETFIANMTKLAGEHKYENNVAACELVTMLKPIAERLERDKAAAKLAIVKAA